MKKLCDLSSLSQAYVFYKLSQTQVISFYKFKPILQYHGTFLFLKNEIKDYFKEYGVSHSRLKHHYGLRQKIRIEIKKKKEPISEGGFVPDAQKQGNFKSVHSNQEKDVEEDYDKSDKKNRKKKQYKSSTEAELDFFLKRYLRFQLIWDDSLNQRIINNIKVYCLLLRLINLNEIVISSIQRGEMNLDILMIQKDLTLRELIKKKGILIINLVRLSVKNGQFCWEYGGRGRGFTSNRQIQAAA
uniref:Uncharacterized protein n=1 Tax=Gossypium raimondii TaxID=29730 RepID=A0A0D2Q807_GOSRA|nr:hypothetical protein B456_002G047700 [Gossypium raimondii]